MLQANTGSIWIGSKVLERIREENQTSKRRNFLVKLAVDKVLKYIITICSTKLFNIFMFNFSGSDGTV